MRLLMGGRIMKGIGLGPVVTVLVILLVKHRILIGWLENGVMFV